MSAKIQAVACSKAALNHETSRKKTATTPANKEAKKHSPSGSASVGQGMLAIRKRVHLFWVSCIKNNHMGKVRSRRAIQKISSLGDIISHSLGNGYIPEKQNKEAIPQLSLVDVTYSAWRGILAGGP